MSGPRILVVEDERIVAEDIRVTLEELGYEIVGVVSTGEEAVSKAAETKPDLALVDIVLAGEMDGIAAAKRMRESCNVPVIYLTAYSAQCTQDRTQATDPFGYLVKPFKRSDLTCAIETALYKHRMETRLRESEQKFRLLYEYAPSAYQSLDQSGRLLEVNKTWLDLFGYSRTEVLNRWFGDFLAPKHQEASCGGILGGESGGRVQGLELEMVKKDGTHLTIALEGIVARDGDGRFKTHHILHDVTECKMAGDALRKREEKCRSILACLPDPIVVYNLDGHAVYVNPAFIDTFGWAAEAVVGTKIDYVPVEEISKTNESLEHLYKGEKASSFETKRLTKDGSILDIKISSSLIMDDCGQPVGNIVSLVDITEMKRAGESQKLMATAVEQAAEAIVIADKDGNTQYVNPAFERISGYSREDVAGKKISPLECPDYNKTFQRQLWNTLTRGEVWNGRVIGRKKDGTVYFEDTTIAPVRDDRGETANFVAVKRDVTREVLLEKELLHAQKMEAVGTLAGGIAHDFNNLLTVILGYSEYLLIDGDIGESARGDLNKLNQAARKGAELVQSLLTFSRKVDPKLSPTNLNHQVEQIKELLGRTIAKKIKISVSLERALAIVHADSSQIQQVLMNLAVNAKDAMPDGGKLAIQTCNVVLDEEFCRSHLGSKPGTYAMVSVSDTGYGMDKEILSHIFEPFYTTKGMGRGTGLGLAMTYGIVKQHGGYIECESAVGEGTTFRVYLPVPDAEALEEIIPQQPVVRNGSETVLLVDDEDSIRDLAKKILVRAGYSVLTASNGREALELYKAEADRISLVILDLVMPEMTGGECLEELVIFDPDARVLIASGSSPDSPTTDGLERLAKGFVWKPYNIRQLLHAVRRALDGE